MKRHPRSFLNWVRWWGGEEYRSDLQTESHQMEYNYDYPCPRDSVKVFRADKKSKKEESGNAEALVQKPGYFRTERTEWGSTINHRPGLDIGVSSGE